MIFLRTAPRAVAAAAYTLALVNIIHLCALVVAGALKGEQVVTPAVLAARLILLSFAPALLGFAVRLTGRARYSVETDRLIIQRRGKRVEIPLGSNFEVRLSRLFFPAPALALRLQSERTFVAERIELADLSSLLRALAPHVESAGPLQGHRLVAFGQARAPLLRHWARRLTVKYVLFPLLPALVAFRAHQYISFGGPFGEYHFYGPVAYARTLAVYVITAVALLVLYGTAWRVIAEGLAALATAVFPHRATRWRHIVEVLCGIAFYFGVPALLAARFLM